MSYLTIVARSHLLYHIKPHTFIHIGIRTYLEACLSVITLVFSNIKLRILQSELFDIIVLTCFLELAMQNKLLTFPYFSFHNYHIQSHFNFGSMFCSLFSCLYLLNYLWKEFSWSKIVMDLHLNSCVFKVKILCKCVTD
jgi:hypothetical protein